MHASLVTIVLAGILALAGTMGLCTLAIVRLLRESLRIEEAIHRAVNSNYQDMLRQNEAQAGEIKLQTQYILELKTRLTALLTQWPAAAPDERTGHGQAPGD